nr:hypothetical transcript [Hymenolepis microstoma]
MPLTSAPAITRQNWHMRESTNPNYQHCSTTIGPVKKVDTNFSQTNASELSKELQDLADDSNPKLGDIHNLWTERSTISTTQQAQKKKGGKAAAANEHNVIKYVDRSRGPKY